MRGETYGFAEVTSSTLDTVFKQQKEYKAHAEMDTKGFKIRECRDSETHPNTVPIILGLDVTGSMGEIPAHLIRDGLPTLMSTLIQRGVPDASLCFVAVGDHECDSHPLQVAQFESGDEELDMWLTRTYIEGGGGGNYGESYPLVWHFAANHVVADHIEKRNKKGFIITIGDEPFLKSIPANALKEIYGPDESVQGTVKALDLLEAARQHYHVFHIFVKHGYRRLDEAWVNALGDNLIIVSKIESIASVIADTVLKHHFEDGAEIQLNANIADKTAETKEETKEENML